MIKIMLICLTSICLTGCAMTWGSNGSATVLMNTSQTYNRSNDIQTVARTIDIKALRTATSAVSVVATGNIFASVTGAVPEAVDTAGTIVKSNLSGGQEVQVMTVTPQSFSPESFKTKSVGVARQIDAPK